MNILATARENDGQFAISDDYNVFSTKIASPKKLIKVDSLLFWLN